MKHIIMGLALLAVLTMTASCGNDDHKGETRIRGQISGLQEGDVIELYGADIMFPGTAHIDVGKEGKFETYLRLDTITQLWMLLPGNTTPQAIFAGNNERISIGPDSVGTAFLHIKGNTEAELYTQFMATDSTGNALSLERIKTFVTDHPQSVVGTCLLNLYMSRTKEPDLRQVQAIVRTLSSDVQHHPQIIDLDKQLTTSIRAKTDTVAPFFRLRTTEGNYLSRTNFKDKWLLMHFWASWDQKSMRENKDFYKPLYKEKEKDKDFAMMGVSLDVDRKEWIRAIEKDTLQWDQVTELRGLNSDVATNYNIRQLPSNVLLSPEGILVARDIDSQEQLEELMKADE